MKKIFYNLFFFSLTFLVFCFNVKAATPQLYVDTPKIIPGNEQVLLPGASTASNQGQILQQKFLPSITTLVIGITGGLSLLFVIIGGIQILTSYNNEEQIGAAKKTITFALVGLLISMLSYAIVQIIISIKLS